MCGEVFIKYTNSWGCSQKFSCSGLCVNLFTKGPRRVSLAWLMGAGWERVLGAPLLTLQVRLFCSISYYCHYLCSSQPLPWNESSSMSGHLSLMFAGEPTFTTVPNGAALLAEWGLLGGAHAHMLCTRRESLLKASSALGGSQRHFL